MTLFEIDSFVFKFKNLLHCKKNASLAIKAEDGRVHIDLSVELEPIDVSATVPGFRHFKTRNSPSMQRWRAKRAAARLSEEEESGKEVSAEGSASTKNSEVVDATEEVVSRANKETIVVDTVTLDEVCTDKVYNEEIDKKEEFTLYYSFKSKHSVEVISDSLRSIFPPDGATSTTLVLRDELVKDMWRSSLHLESSNN